MTEQDMPQRLALDEIGTWDVPSNSNDPDAETWHFGGWAARDYNGIIYCQSRERDEVERWLIANGYQFTSDGWHFEREISVESEQ